MIFIEVRKKNLKNLKNNIKAMKEINTLNEITKNTLIDNLGIKFTSYDEVKEILTAELEVTKDFLQPFGYLHGGISFTLAETLGSFLSYLSVDPEKFYVFGTQINGYHVKAIREGKLKVYSNYIHKGKSTHILKIEIFDQENNLIHYSTMTNRIVKKDR